MLHDPNLRTVSGMRPTGPLHIGHYFGALKNWVPMQETHSAYFFVADWHALTSDYADTSKLKGFVRGLVIDWLASGLDPEKCVIFQQSKVLEHAELSLLDVYKRQVQCYPRDILHKVLERKASGFFLVHNHPGGTPKASPEDAEMTRNIQRLATGMGLRLLDHLIIGDGVCYSIREDGLI